MMRALVFLAMLTGCSGAARQSTLHAAVVTVDTGCSAALAYAHKHSEDMIAHAASREDARAKLTAFRAKVDRVDTACTAAYRALALAASLEDGSGDAAARAAVVDAAKQATELQGGMP